MEILNILYNNNNIAFYLIGAIIVTIIIFIVISSMSTNPKDKEEKTILKDPTEDENYLKMTLEPDATELKDIHKINDLIENNYKNSEPKNETEDIPKINDIVDDLYQKSLNIEEPVKEENKDINTFLQEFEVPNNVIDEVLNANNEEDLQEEIELPNLKNEEPIELNNEEPQENKSENLENMLKRLYDLRQNEKTDRKNALLTEIYDLKKQVDEALKTEEYNYSFNLKNVDNNALSDYYLFNEDIEFPKLK